MATPPRMGRPRLTVDMEQALRLRAAGFSLDQTAARLGISRMTMWTRLREQRRAA